MAFDLRRAAPADLPVLRQLLELYQYDLSDLWPQTLDAHGRYGYDLQPWADDRRGRFTAWMARVDGSPAGFALVAPAIVTRSTGCWMDQFFVVRAHRRSGLGRALAHFVFDQHPGPWEVGQMPSNVAAMAFWRRVIGEYTRGCFTERAVTEGWWQGTVQQFDASPATRPGGTGTAGA